MLGYFVISKGVFEFMENHPNQITIHY